MTTGTAIPPTAAAAGSTRRRRSRSSPLSSSRLASSPTTRKKNVMSPWFTTCRRSSEIPASPTRMETVVVQNDSYESHHGEFAQSSASTDAATIATALPVSLLKKSRTGAVRFRAHAVLARCASGVELADASVATCNQECSQGQGLSTRSRPVTSRRGYACAMEPNRARELLARERRRIEKALGRLRREPDEELSHLDQHPGDEGTEVFEEERDEGFVDSLNEELAAVERAERRLEQGTYGVSVESGRPIPDERLEAVPWAERTQEEQERFDRGAGGLAAGPPPQGVSAPPVGWRPRKR